MLLQCFRAFHHSPGHNSAHPGPIQINLVSLKAGRLRFKMYIFDFPICKLFNCPKIQKHPKMTIFEFGGQGSFWSRAREARDQKINYGRDLFPTDAWSNGTKISSIRAFKKAVDFRKICCVRTGSFFDRAKTGVKVLRSRQLWYQNFGHQMLYKLYFDHFSPNPLRKKLFAKNTFFNHPQKHVFRV